MIKEPGKTKMKHQIKTQIRIQTAIIQKNINQILTLQRISIQIIRQVKQMAQVMVKIHQILIQAKESQ